MASFLLIVQKCLGRSACNALAGVARRLCTSRVDPEGLSGFVACRLAPLDKDPGVRPIHSKKRTTCSGLMKTGLNNVLQPTLFKVVNNIVTPDCRVIQAHQLVQYC